MDVKRIQQWPLGGLAKILNVLLILAIAYELATLTLALLSEPEGPPSVPRIGQGTTSGPTGPDLALDALMRLRLFGGRGDGTGSSASAPTVGAVSETNLDIQLLGIIFMGANNAESARALLKTPSEGERSYRVGDPLPGGGVIRAIEAERVFFDFGGRRQMLTMPRSSEGLDQLRPEAPQRGVDPAAAREGLRWLRDQLQVSPEQILGKVALDPFYEGGAFIGFRLTPGDDPDFLGQFGLQSGDVVTEVNGIEMISPLKGMEALGQLASATQVALRVKRGEARHSFSYSLD